MDKPLSPDLISERIPPSSAVKWAYAAYIVSIFNYMFLGDSYLLSALSIGMLVVVLVDSYILTIYFKKRRVMYPRRIWLFALLTGLFPPVMVPVYLYARARINKEAINKLKAKERGGSQIQASPT